MATNTADITANAQPAVITIHPDPCALECFNTTFATQPFPSKIKTIVPMNSPSTAEVVNACSLCCGLAVKYFLIAPGLGPLSWRTVSLSTPPASQKCAGDFPPAFRLIAPRSRPLSLAPGSHHCEGVDNANAAERLAGRVRVA